MKYYLLITIGLTLALSSCIKENWEQCPGYGKAQSLRIVFSHEDGTAAIPPNELQNAILYVFDADNLLVDFREINNPKLNEAYEPDFTLAPGNYSFVVWFNPLSPYAVVPTTAHLSIGVTQKSEGKFQLQLPANRIVQEPATVLPLALYGRQQQVIAETGETTVIIPVIQQTNRIHITVNGLTPNAHTYRFAITDDNGIYTFDNAFAPCATFSYIAETQYSGTQLSASLTVLRLSESHPTPVLTIMDADTQEMLFPHAGNIPNNLIELLKTIDPDNDFDQRHEYTIDIVFSGNDVWINGWKVVSSDTGLISF
ncbi:MAG: FimB/Mfa2 family fimbrial subunit [Dysgonamonadaceae bacterium]|jgi:hypothetical protein|nr:FimB/Mfa2 family fimbrial subunit [Dysgonamonadaceae bacterium]